MLFALAILACSGDKSRSGEPHAFKVALLTPGPISHQSWNDGAYDELIRIRDGFSAKISHTQTKTPAEFDENFRQYGGLHDEIVRFVFNPRLESTIPARVRAQVDSARDALDGRTRKSAILR